MTATLDEAVADLQRANAELQRKLDGRTRQLDERTAQLDEALARESATAEVLGVINSSPGELAPVFDAMLEKATRMCEAETAHLLRYENEVFSRIASRGVPEDFDKILPLNTPVPHIITRDSIPYRMVATRAVVHVHDSREDESVRAGAPDQTAAAASGIRTALFVPLLKEGDVVGGFVMHRMECAHSPTSRSHWSKTLRRRRSLRWRTPG